MQVKITKIKPVFILLATFVLAALVMTSYEIMKEMIFHGTLTPWQSHTITIFVTATIATGIAAWIYGWVKIVNNQVNAAKN